MKRSPYDKWLGGVIGGISNATGIDSGLLRVVFIVFFFGVGGLSFGIGSGTVAFIYFLMWWIIDLDE